MWTARLQPLGANTIQVTLDEQARSLTFQDVIDRWQTDDVFRAMFARTLADAPMDAFFWETPPVTRRTLDRLFECVLVPGSALLRLTSDPAPFQAQFDAHPSDSVQVFPNLGGDALLVVPSPVADHAAYTHLARFLRQAPPEQVDAFWRCAAIALAGRISDRPTWLSTAGMGVSWLHLRLDSRPKYYRHAPYKANPA